MSLADLHKLQMDAIIKHGHCTIFAAGSPYPWAYTVGRTVRDRPELLITGVPHPQVAAVLINTVAALDDSAPLEAGTFLDKVLADGYLLCLDQADPFAARMYEATNAFGDDVTCLQLVWPDKDHRFPAPHQPLYPA